MGADYTISHAADLAANLPPESRCGVYDDPINAWTLEACLLALVEYHLNSWNWAHTEDAKTGANRPKLRIPLPEDEKPDGLKRMTVDEVVAFMDGLVGERTNGGSDG